MNFVSMRFVLIAFVLCVRSPWGDIPTKAAHNDVGSYPQRSLKAEMTIRSDQIRRTIDLRGAKCGDGQANSGGRRCSNESAASSAKIAATEAEDAVLIRQCCLRTTAEPMESWTSRQSPQSSVDESPCCVESGASSAE
ncbi:MAG TPA: hypothetical protein VJJ98_00430 [Sedimentisphaerales bacterium]|nr:hypothetical protein [Sedimentisphaerales bacterium]